MTMDIRPTTLRRICEICEQQYLHRPVTASGPTATGEHRHLMACSWPCLEELVATTNNVDALVEL